MEIAHYTLQKRLFASPIVQLILTKSLRRENKANLLRTKQLISRYFMARQGKGPFLWSGLLTGTVLPRNIIKIITLYPVLEEITERKTST